MQKIRMTYEQLRNSILQLALQGKLIKQDLSDNSVLELVKQISKERDELILNGEIKRNKQDSFIYKDVDGIYFEKVNKEIKDISHELPFEIPSNWTWCRLKSIGDYKKGPFGSALTKEIFVKKSVDTIKVYEQQNAIQKDHSLGSYYITSKYYNEKMRSFSVRPGDIIVSCAGTIGETYVLPSNIEQGIINQALMRMRISKYINIDYFLLYFNTILKKTAKTNSKGSAIKNIPPFEVFKELLLPLPPISEQLKIVDKINKIDELLLKYKTVEESINKMEVSLPLKLQQSILFQAVQGKLSLNKSFNTDIKDTLEHIYLCKTKELRNGLIIDKKHTPDAIQEDEIPFEIPNSWRWVKLGDISTFYAGKTPERHNTNYWQNPTMPWVSITDMVSNGITVETKEKISETAVKECLPKCVSPKGTLIMSFKLTIGKVSYLGIDATHNEAIISIFPFAKDKELNILKDYLFTILPFMVNYGESKNAIKGRTLNATSLTNLYIPLPSFEEQEYIVNKVKELKLLVDSLN